jgi:hypothetical protein
MLGSSRLLASYLTLGLVHAFAGKQVLLKRRRQTISKLHADKSTTGVSEPSPLLLQPFAPAADPNYLTTGPIGEGDFIIQRTGDPTADELSNENILKIVTIECTDLEVNTLAWKALGYRFNPDTNQWSNEMCFPKWRDKYPTPPDLVGMRRIYEKEIDQPVLKANQSIVRSVPVEFKQSLKKNLIPLGFKGYKYAELTPNKTRRAQVANWLLYFRDELFGYTIDELQERRRLQKQAEEKALEGKPAEWKPPVTEVF